jgi:excisionase family DNA binding protein
MSDDRAHLVPDDQLTLAQAAELLGVSPATLTQQARKGTLSARKIGKTYVTTRDEVERYRRDHLGRVGRSSKHRGLEGLLAAIGQDLDEAEGEADALDFRPMEPPAPKPRQRRFPMDAPKPEFGQPIDAPRARKRQPAGITSAPVNEDKVGDFREVQRTLFSDPVMSVEQELDFYQHEMDWANRMILGDSLLVMNRRPPTTGRKAVWNESAATPGTSPDSQWPLGTALARYAPHHGCAQTRAE